MKHLLAIATLILGTVLFAGASSAQQLSLDEISDYLNDMGTAQGGFTQINADGSRLTGQIYIKRPGRVRFEYDPPAESLVIAGGGSLAIFDGRSNTGPERYPLRQTPLHVLLARDVDLGAAREVTEVSFDGTSTIVTAQDPDNPQYGRISMFFQPGPVRLVGWVVTDDLGTQTTTVLNELVYGGTIREILFNIRAETRKRE